MHRGAGTPRYRGVSGRHSIGSLFGRDLSPDNEYLLKRCEQCAAGRSHRVLLAHSPSLGIATAATTTTTKALSRSPGRNLARAPRWYTARSAISREGSEQQHTRASIHRRRNTEKRPSPRVPSGFVAVHYLAYAIAPRYICHRAPTRSRGRSTVLLALPGTIRRCAMRFSSVNGLFPIRLRALASSSFGGDVVGNGVTFHVVSSCLNMVIYRIEKESQEKKGNI